MSLVAKAFPLARPFIHMLDAEKAHRLTIRALTVLPKGRAVASPPSLKVSAFGLDFPNPLGLAAGFDKNAEVADAMLAQGFGFVEVGTLTPKPQEGNAKPRLFRLAEDRAVINRMGFNNDGHWAALKRLEARRGRPGIVGVNIGANKDSGDRIADYVQGIAFFSAIADYFTVNISSPNTPGLRALQSRAELDALLARLNEAREKQARRPPMLLKIAPDLRGDELEDIAQSCGRGAVDGILVSNTTISRPTLISRARDEMGGLSGEPLFELSTRQLAKLYLLTKGRIPLVGAGGIGSAKQAWAKITAGATLLQLYSALVYEGPGLVPAILEGLRQRFAVSGKESLAAITGSAAKDWAHQGDSGT
ncbi:quinone-dependent dihydroorotate dehydrogenase [Aestuariivirga sp.]|uniref:quinone-dependent dihydroorotate dehydrogenase n=1 Tax=Aestuariivirga sp. TaxID=2650926 RepID=UPI0039E221AF